MTSNVLTPMQTTATPQVAPTENTALDLAPIKTGASTTFLLPEKTGAIGVDPKANSGAGRVGGKLTVVAQALLPPIRPGVLVNSWMRALEPAPSFSPTVGVPPVLPRSTMPSPSLFVPLSPLPTPLGSVFSPGSQMRTGQGVPQMSKPLERTALAIVNSALDPARLRQFTSLTTAQQEVARGLLSAAIERLQAPPGSAERIAPQDFSPMVGQILDRAGGGQASQPSRLSLPTPTERELPTPASRELPKPTARALPTPTPRVAQSTSITAPSSSNSTPLPAADQPLAAYPSTGPNDPEPAWWKEACNDPNDPQMGSKLARLVTDSREFAAQAATIDIDRPVDPARSTLTPRQEWNKWKQA